MLACSARTVRVPRHTPVCTASPQLTRRNQAAGRSRALNPISATPSPQHPPARHERSTAQHNPCGHALGEATNNAEPPQRASPAGHTASRDVASTAARPAPVGELPAQLHAAAAHAPTRSAQASIVERCSSAGGTSGGTYGGGSDADPETGEGLRGSDSSSQRSSDGREETAAGEHGRTGGGARTKQLQAALSRILAKEGGRIAPKAEPTSPARGQAQAPAAPTPAAAPAQAPERHPSTQQRADGSRGSDRLQAGAPTSPRVPPSAPGPRSQQGPPRSPSPGTITLPSGPTWSTARKQFHPRPHDPKLPHQDCIVLVEGSTDCFRVQRAMDVAAYAVGGSGIMTQRASDDVKLLATLGHDLIILMDPDREGNVLRDHLETLLGSKARHAFIPAASATSSSASSRHEAGNLGVEHAGPGAIWRSVQSAAPSYGRNRKEFSLEELMELGLANSFNAKEVEGAKLRRSLVCGALGVGQASGSTLVKILNRYISRKQFEAALASTNTESPST